MKRLLVVALGLGVALGTLSFAQDSSKDTSGQKMVSKKKTNKKKASKTTGDTTTK